MSTVPARRIRRAARVLLLDAEDRALLFRFTPPWSGPFWVTPGGECDPGEDYPAAARRELFEETGIVADPVPLDHVREEDFDVQEHRIRAVEYFFYHRTDIATIDVTGHTAFEREAMQEHRWFTRVDLASWPETIYPQDIGALIDRAIREENRRHDTFDAL